MYHCGTPSVLMHTAMGQYGAVVVSPKGDYPTDHENDTPERLAEFAEQQRANNDGWHFVMGSASDIRTWAALMGIRYRQNPNGGYDHSNVIGVLNAEGELVHRHEGLNRHHEKVAQAVRAL